MDIYLVRHGKAEPGEDDDVRPLTKGGRAASERVAKALAARGIFVQRVEHSPLLRAVQTAEPFGTHLGARLRTSSDLGPGGDVEAVRGRILTEQPASIMLVGHNPFMERLAALLISEDPDQPVLSFHTASTARLVSIGLADWRFTCDWLITPSLLK